MFISFEGIDKSGKTTQVNLLAKFLTEKSYPVLLTKEPGGTKIGEKIKKILLEDSQVSPLAELFLYLADRHQHVEKVIKPSLKVGKVVISDRYADASLAYQGYGRGLGIEFVKKLNQKVTDGIMPDITFLLDLEPEKTMPRANRFDRIEKEKLTFHRRVREGYLEMANFEPQRFKVIRADTTVYKIHEKVKSVISEYLK
ncbi:dTMP kinase [Candidatus Aerophobetes bacterium]|nr:dTMP kinase [Candidatus Aerophobetes bacterium]